MTYSIIGILAITIHLIINRDMLWHNNDNTNVPAHKEYRDYVLGIIVFCITDVLWGFFDQYHLIIPLYIDTVIYFITMMASFLMWMRYVVAYINGSPAMKKSFRIFGIVLFSIEIIILTINFFVPIKFWYDENGAYHTGKARYATLILQIILFVVTSLYTFMIKGSDMTSIWRLRRAVGLCGIIMAALIFLQLFYPLLPLYSIGYLISSCLLHSFVVEDEKEEYSRALERILQQEKMQREELGDVKNKVYTDSLTGVKSRQAYLEDVNKLDEQIRNDSLSDDRLSIAVFDVNDLKMINDTMGHDTGDVYIYTAALLICEHFKNCSVYRIGGDEFAAIINGKDFSNRKELMRLFNLHSENNMREGKVVVSSGMADFRKNTDKNIRAVFDIADKRMYQRKHQLKEMQHFVQQKNINNA